MLPHRQRILLKESEKLLIDHSRILVERLLGAEHVAHSI